MGLGNSQQMSEWYIFLSQFSAALSGPLGALSGGTGVPVLSAYVLGLVGATAPCQLSANLAALAYLSREGRGYRRTAGSIGAYLSGKILVYSIIGLIALVFGLSLVSASSIPFFSVVRKAMGPSLVLAGLLMAGVLRLPFSLGDSLRLRLTRNARNRGAWGAFLLGAGFSLAFCPTLFVLFFVLLLPLSAGYPGGFVFPGLFAIGTATPLLVLGPLISLGLLGRYGLAGKAHSVDRVVRIVTGAVFVILGLNEIVNYWLA